MSLHTLSNPAFIFNPHIVPPSSCTRPVLSWNPAIAPCSLTKWRGEEFKEFGKSFPRFKIQFWVLDVGKRASEVHFSFRNSGGLVRVRCGGLERENEEDAFYIRRSVELARQAVGHTSPNPMVGCVIVRDGKVVGEGFHPRAGQPHAEVFALRNAGALAENATAYVSLEPCNHYGRTSPCTEALINAKVKKVVVGMVDPNPIVSQRGLIDFKKLE